MSYLKQLFRAAVFCSSALFSSQALAQSPTLCADYSWVANQFEKNGVVFRGMAQGPNYRTLRIYEDTKSGKAMGVLYDPHSNKVCPVAYGMNFSDFEKRVSVVKPGNEAYQKKLAGLIPGDP